MTDFENRIYRVTASIDTQVTQDFGETIEGSPVMYPRQASVFKSSSLEVYSNVRFRNLRHRRRLNAAQLDISASDSWTQHRTIGSSQAFVITPISSSQQEVVSGLFYSGTEIVGDTPVPHSRSLFYEKSPTLKRSVYKWLATSSMGGFNATFGQQVGTTASIDDPHQWRLEIRDHGRIVDIKVWVEIIQTSGSGGHPPLGSFGISMRAPCVSWGHAHPLRNVSKFDNEHDPVLFEEPPEFYKDTFILWEPASLFRYLDSHAIYSGDDIDVPGTAADPALRMPCWDRDGGMRTVFCDGSNVRNPRDIYDVYVGRFSAVKDTAKAATSPNGQYDGGTSGLMLGNATPWYSDTDFSYRTAAGSPPDGWLTGAGGVAEADEWPTTGSNYGPHTIRPVYPFLDDIYVRKLYHNEGTAGFGGLESYRFRNWRDWIAFRPGLRGKDMYGDWIFMIARGVHGVLTDPNISVRQWRIEVIYEQIPETLSASLAPPRTPRRSSNVREAFSQNETGQQLQLVAVLSGSKDVVTGGVLQDIQRTYADYFINGVYVPVGYEVERFRTIGLITTTASLAESNFAVYTASSSLPIVTASYDRASIIDVLDQPNPLAGPKSLSSIVRSSVVKETTEQSARRLLSGTI